MLEVLGSYFDFCLQLKDKSLFIEKCYVNGEWVGAQSGQTFEVHGKNRTKGRE
jgi:hypothetical protein